MRCHMRARLPGIVAAIAFCIGPMMSAARAAAGNPVPARIVASDVLPGAGGSWGFAAKDPTRPYLFIARREHGLTVFDVDRRRVVRTLADSRGANAVVFAPTANRAYVSNMDGSVTIVRLSDLATLSRLQVTDANLNSAVYEPVSGRVVIASGRRATRSTLFVLDPRQDRIVMQRDVDIKKIDPLLATGDGALLLPMRDEGRIMRLDAATLEITATWSYGDCEQPSALAADTASRRLFIACRGKTPQLVVADLDTGAQRGETLPAPRAVNALAYDAGRRLLLMPSGADAGLTVIAQGRDSDHWHSLGELGTRPWAHNMAYDAGSGRAWLFTMDFAQPAPEPDGRKRDPVFYKNTFTVLTVGIGERDPS